MKSPQVTQFINLKTTGVQQTQGQFDRLSASLNRYSQNLKNSTTATKKQNQELDYFSDQGLANIQTGLLQVTTFAMNMNQKLNNVFEKMTNRFGTAEQAVTQLKISMGLIGERTSANEHLFRDFDRMIKVVDRLAGTTKFTKVEVTNALNSLIKGGLEASQAIGLLDPMIKFVSASAGQIDLETGAEIARKTYSTLGGELATVEDNLNRLFKATQKTPLGMDELNEFLTGIRDASKKFGETDKMEANILALGAAIRSTGISGREAGGLINQFAKGAMDMVAQLDKSRIRKGQRVNVKREYILELLGISKRQMSDSQIRAIMKDRQTEINRLRDKYAEQMFVETKPSGDKVLKDPEKFIKTIMDNYSRVLNELGTQGAKTVLGKAFGKAVGPQFVNAINNIVEQNKQRGIKNYGELVKMLDEHNNEITTAHKLSLDDLKSRAAVLESSYDALFQSIMEHDVYGKESLDTHSTVITAIKDLVKGNSSLAVSMSAIGRTAQIATSVITNLGFALVAAATFAIGAKYAGLGAAGSMVSLSSVVGAFHKTFLAPTLRVLLLFGGGLTTAGLFAVAFARNLSDSGTVAGGFRDTLISVKKQVKSLVALFKLSTDKKFGSETLSKLVTRYKDLRESMRNLHLVRFNAEVRGNAEVLQRSQEELNKLNAEYREFQRVAGVENLQAFMELDPEKQSGIVKLMETLKLTFNAISSLVNGMLIPISSTLGYVVDSFIGIAKIIFTPIQAILNMFGFFSDETGESFALKALGILIGSFMSLKVIIGSVTMVIGTLTGFVTGAITRHANLSNTIKTLSRDFRELSTVKEMSQLISGKAVLHTTNRIKEISIIDKLVLTYLKLTGQTKRYQAVVDTLNGANIRLTNTSARTNDTLGMVNQKLKMNSAVLTNAANSLSRYNSLMGTGRDRAMMFGNALLMVSGFITMFASDTGSAGHLFSNFISIVTMGIFALQAVLTLFGTTITRLFMSNPILLGLIGLAGLIGSFFLAKNNVDKAVKRQTFGADTNPPESYGSTKAHASNSMLAQARPQNITNNNTFNYNDNSNITTTDANLENTITARQKNINFFKFSTGNESISL